MEIKGKVIFNLTNHLFLFVELFREREEKSIDGGEV